MRRTWIALGVLALLIVGGVLAWRYVDRENGAPTALPGASSAAASWDPAYVPQPVEGAIAPHPWLAAVGNGTMHGDGFQSDVHPASGPMGPAYQVRSRRAGNGMIRQCATFVYRSDGKPIAMCGGLTGFRLVLLDPDSLEMLASYELPMRPSTFQALVKRDLSVVMNDTSGGAYLFLDNRDRVVLADSNQVIQRIATRQVNGQWQFVVDGSWDMASYVPHDCQNYDNWFPTGECDMLTTIMPDMEGRYWWVTRYGRVGTLAPEGGAIGHVTLPGEEIQNAFAVDDKAVYIITDQAQYAFTAGADGKPRILWRHPYDRGTTTKVGSINRGSGTTPTLLGDRYITFTDNADGRINLIVLRRGALAEGEHREICRVPMFAQGASATDNSMIGIGRSILLENNAGYASSFAQKDWGAIAGGVTRVDIRADESGCDMVWTSPLKVPSVVAKLSQANGVAYYYSFDPAPGGGQDWSVVGLDFRTGKQVLKVPTGRGSAFDNNWASLSIAPNGDLYVGVKRGLLQVRAPRR